MKNWRINFLFLFFILIAAALISRLFFLQVKNHSFWAAMARGQHYFSKDILPERGEIFAQDKDGKLYPLAKNKDWKIIYAMLSEIKDASALSQNLAQVLNIDQKEILSRLQESGPSYKVMAKQVEPDLAKNIVDLNLEGIYITDDFGRYYPQGNFASHLVGFLGFEGEGKIGQYGLEGFYNDELSGRAGFFRGERDALGNLIALAKQRIVPSKDGDNLVLTIDTNIQYQAEKLLKEYYDKLEAEEGTIIVSDPVTGAIKAMASLPNFDPGNYGKERDFSVFLNPAVQKIFEPGSVFKPITMAAAIDAGKISPETTYIDEGEVKIGGYVIKNVNNKVYKTQTMTQVLEQSINTGAVFAQRELGPELFRKYVENFGFSSKTGIDLLGEVKGNISNLETQYEINFATASFGQGIAVTPIELTAAFGAIANQGKMMKPYIVERFLHVDGSQTQVKPQATREVISSKAASKIVTMMISTVDNGFGKKAGVSGYYVAGKTGTAQIPSLEKRGYTDKVIHSFAGFAPAFDPKFLIFIKIDNPKGIAFAADSITPLFRRLAEYIIHYYGIPPER